MAKLTFDDGKYTVHGNLGCWVSSKEKVEVGTVRFIAGKLMFAYTVRTSYTTFPFKVTRTHWVAVEIGATRYSHDDIRQWKKGLIDG